jgi:hypothetical protein
MLNSKMLQEQNTADVYVSYTTNDLETQSENKINKD